MSSLRLLSLPCVALSFALTSAPRAHAEDELARVRKAVERSTLDQKGTYPFHLSATLAPSFDRDKDSGRTGTIEIWWKAPGEMRREIRTPQFHQVQVVSGGRTWEINEGDYIPEWAREMAEALLHPVSPDALALHGIKPDIMKSMAGATYLNWEKSLPVDQQPAKEDISIWENSGLLFYGGGLGWDFQLKDFSDFHGRLIAHTVTCGSPEVKAKVTLEDLSSMPADFDTPTGGAPLRTIVIDNAPYAPDLASGSPTPAWPAVTNTPLNGVVWTELVLDATGHVRDSMNPISDNPAINEAAKAYFQSLVFKPVIRDGAPVQIVRRIAIPFTLKRPEGFVDLGTARQNFDLGRKGSSPASAGVGPYELRAQFTVGTPSGSQTGTYTDTFVDTKHWKREAVLGSSIAVRSRDGEQYYWKHEGQMANICSLVLEAVEPIPTLDTMTESDWRITREDLKGTSTVRVYRGGEPDVDLSHANGYWFDADHRLVQALYNSTFFTYTNLQPFGPGSYPRLILGRSRSGALGLKIEVQSVSTSPQVGRGFFKVSGAEWQRKFTSEER